MHAKQQEALRLSVSSADWAGGVMEPEDEFALLEGKM